MARTEGGRRRNENARQDLRRPDFEFVNPYPWMSGIEAMVHLALEEHQVPFSWRLFDGEAPIFRELLVNQGYHPEFTIREQRTVIIVQGTYFGSLPGVLDKVALAKVTLEEDGWKVILLWEPDIRSVGAWELIRREAPNLAAVQGAPRPNPFQPFLNLLSRRRRGRRAYQPKVESIGTRQRGEDSVRRRVRRVRRRVGDSGRRRVGSVESVSGRFKSR